MIFLKRYKKYCISIKKSDTQICHLPIIICGLALVHTKEDKKIYMPMSKLCIFEDLSWYKLYIFKNRHTNLKNIAYSIFCGFSEMDSGDWFQPMVFHEIKYSHINTHYLVGYLQYKNYNIYITNKRWIIYYNNDIIVLNSKKKIEFVVSDMIRSNQYYQDALYNIFNDLTAYDTKHWHGDEIIEEYQSRNVENAKYYQNGKWYKYELVEV
jgi:hypothetical protein